MTETRPPGEHQERQRQQQQERVQPAVEILRVVILAFEEDTERDHERVRQALFVHQAPCQQWPEGFVRIQRLPAQQRAHVRVGVGSLVRRCQLLSPTLCKYALRQRIQRISRQAVVSDEPRRKHQRGQRDKQHAELHGIQLLGMLIFTPIQVKERQQQAQYEKRNQGVVLRSQRQAAAYGGKHEPAGPARVLKPDHHTE